MPWVKIDDHYDENPKIAAAGPLAVPMWLAGLAYCNRNLTDGFIPRSIAKGLVVWDFDDPTGPSRIYVGGEDYVHEDSGVTCVYVIELLLASGLWTEVTGGYLVHDFEKYQPTRAQVEAERASKVAAGRAGGQASAQARGQAGAQAQSKPVPVPVPVPLAYSEKQVSLRTLSAREGLPNITPAVQEAGEAITGQGILAAGDKQLTELDRLVESHGPDAVVKAFASVANGQRLAWRQLVWGTMKQLEPIPGSLSKADAKEAEREEAKRKFLGGTA